VALALGLLVPSFKNTASIFPEVFFIQYFTVNISETKKDISKIKMPNKSNRQKLFFISYTLYKNQLKYKLKNLASL